MARSRRRGKGEGTIFKRKNGSWQGAITTGVNDDGKQQRKTVYGRSQAEVRAKLDELKQHLAVGATTVTAMTLKDYLARWLEAHEQQVKPRTIETYRYNLDKYLLPRLGHVKLDKLRPLPVQAALAEIARQVGPRTSNICRGILLAAMRQAVRWRLLAHNPIEGVVRVKEPTRAMVIWTPEQARLFLDVARKHRLYPLFYLAIATGLRCGELLGLRWGDLEGDTLTVRRTLDTLKTTPRISTPKTERGHRRVVLGSSALRVLEEHRAQQERQRRRLGVAWPDTGHVFVSEAGTHQNARNLTRAFHLLQRKARARLRKRLKASLEGEALKEQLKRLRRGELFPHARLHDLRHLNVSIRRRLGQDAKLIADQVGHADPAFTTRLYTHLFEDEREDAGVELDDMLDDDDEG